VGLVRSTAKRLGAEIPTRCQLLERLRNGQAVLALRPWRTAWHLANLRECSDGRYSLWRCDTIAKRGELLSVREPVLRVGNPSLAQAHQPFHERRSGSESATFGQNRRGRGGPSGDALPSGDGSGVASPASKNSSISANAASGEGWRPRRVTRSIT